MLSLCWGNMVVSLQFIKVFELQMRVKKIYFQFHFVKIGKEILFGWYIGVINQLYL